MAHAAAASARGRRAVRMDRFEQLKIIGRGNYGAAHLVVEKATGRKLVVKKVPISEMSDEERKQASQEVRQHATCSARSVCAVQASGGCACEAARVACGAGCARTACACVLAERDVQGSGGFSHPAAHTR